MDAGGTLKIVAAGLGWRMGRASSGRALVEALGGDDEQLRMLAGMNLVRAGERSVDLIESAIADGTASPQAVELLADLGGHRARVILEREAAGKGPTAEAARRALDLLDRIDQLGDED